MSGSSAKPPRSAPIPRRWSRSSCARARIPSRGSAPASASCGLAKRYDAERLDAACARALALGTRSYSSVAAILKNAQERQHARTRTAQPAAREHSRSRLLPLKGETMLIHPLAERLRGLGMAAMADAFLEMQSQFQRRRPHPRGLARPAARPRGHRPRQQAARPTAAPGQTAPERGGRGHRLPHAARPRPRAVPQARRLRLDPPQPAPGDQRPDRRRQIVAGLRVGAQSLPGRLLGDLPPGAAAVRRTRHRPR